MKTNLDLDNAVSHMQEGGIVAVPTESVYGFSCDPSNINSIKRLIKLKKRSLDKGFILIAVNFRQLDEYIYPLNDSLKQKINVTENVTWVVPAKPNISNLITGKFHNTVAIRITRHTVLKELLKRFGKALISTSANISGQLPTKDMQVIKNTFSHEDIFILKGNMGSLLQPTKMYDAINNTILRK